MSGGAGADTFVLEPDPDPVSLGDVITDFQDGIDTIEVQGGLSFAELTISDAGGGNSRVEVEATNEVLAVVQVDTGNLLEVNDFAFV